MPEACREAGKEVLPHKAQESTLTAKHIAAEPQGLSEGNKDTSGSPCGKTQHTSRHFSDHSLGAMFHDRARIVKLLRRCSNMRSH